MTQMPRKSEFKPSELFGEPFKEIPLKDEMKLSHLDNLSLSSYDKFSLKKLHFRESAKLLPISAWKHLDFNSVASFFQSPKGKTFIVKPEMEVFPKLGTIGRTETRRPRYMIPVMTELIRRRVNIEVPIGYIETHEGVNFYIVKASKGITLTEALQKASKKEKEEIAEGLGKELARVHGKGVVHLHPHCNNWIVDGVKPKLVDVKAVAFDTDFPHTFKVSGHVLRWEQVIRDDRLITAQSLQSKELREKFFLAYEKEMWRRANLLRHRRG